MRRAKLREDALACLKAGVAAVDPRALVARCLRRLEGPPPAGRLYLAAFGKAAPAMARGVLDVWPGSMRRGIVVTTKEQAGDVPAGLETRVGGHPLPDPGSVAAGEEVFGLASGLEEDDFFLVLISGGGSALLTYPPETIPLGDVARTTRLIQNAGGSIRDCNAVRRRIDRLKGGRLARAAAPARVLALALSDVVGDPPAEIASGPLVPDPTSAADACDILARLGIWEKVAHSVRAHLERGRRGEGDDSPARGDPCFERVSFRIVGNNRLAAEGVLGEAARRGYRPALVTTVLSGEAREAGRFVADLALEARRSGHLVAPPACLVLAGETTVTVRGSGTGGRCQELALGAALELAGVEDVCVAAMGSDGIDGPTDAAGAIAFGDTVGRAQGAGLDARAALGRNDSGPFFAALQDRIVTGRTGTNVMDLVVALAL